MPENANHRLSRRDFLASIPMMALATSPGGGTDLAPPLRIVPRAAWGKDLPVRGPLVAERLEDVRFLLVHHSASTNEYGRDEVVSQIRGFYQRHTGPLKRWPDVAYNFFVDRFGGVWEGRSGSIDRPVKADATGGSQGFALLCCFIGDHRVSPPSVAARSAMISLLGWLGARYGIALRPGSKATFVSRGSNRWPAGRRVVTPTVAGHRDMSLTECPGNAAYVLVQHVFPAAAAHAAAALAKGGSTSPSLRRTTPEPPSSEASSVLPGTSRPTPARRDPGGTDTTLWLGAAAILAAGGLVTALARRTRPEPLPQPLLVAAPPAAPSPFLATVSLPEAPAPAEPAYAAVLLRDASTLPGAPPVISDWKAGHLFMTRLLGARVTMAAVAQGDDATAHGDQLAHLLAHSIRADSRFLEGRLDLLDYDPERLARGMFERAERRASDRLRTIGQPVLRPSMACVLILNGRLVCATGGDGLVVAELDSGELRACARIPRQRAAVGERAPAELLRIEELPAPGVRRLMLYPRMPSPESAGGGLEALEQISQVVGRHADAELAVGADLVRVRSDGLAVAVLSRLTA
jgi:hypothetical protein